MAKKIREEEVDYQNVPEPASVELELKKVDKDDFKFMSGIPSEKNSTPTYDPDIELLNCLRNEKVNVKFLPKPYSLARDPKHVLYGGMSENATRTFVVPILKSGTFANVLTNSEKKFLEYALGLENDALSVYKKTNNFWSTANSEGISGVTLHKQDNYLDLSDPVDYIKYKILLANKDLIAPSLKEWQDHPKATYQFVIVSEEANSKDIKSKLSIKKQCYKELGKIEDDADLLRLIIEIVNSKPLSSKTKIELLQQLVDEIIEANGKLFLKIISDPYLRTKVLVKKAVEAGIISKRGDYYYLRENGTPLCEDDQNPTLNAAAAYLDMPKHQELKFTIEAKVKE